MNKLEANVIQNLIDSMQSLSAIAKSESDLLRTALVTIERLENEKTESQHIIEKMVQRRDELEFAVRHGKNRIQELEVKLSREKKSSEEEIFEATARMRKFGPTYEMPCYRELEVCGHGYEWRHHSDDIDILWIDNVASTFERMRVHEKIDRIEEVPTNMVFAIDDHVAWWIADVEVDRLVKGGIVTSMTRPFFGSDETREKVDLENPPVKTDE